MTTSAGAQLKDAAFRRPLPADAPRQLLEKPFVAGLRDNYSISGQLVDFKDAEKACQLINDWAKKHTAERITEIVTPRELEENTHLMLASAVAFQGRWAKEFDPKMTRDDDFHVSKTRTVKVPTMRHSEEGQFNFYPGTRDGTGDPVYALRMPFKGGEMEFVVLLPGEGSSLEELTKLLAAEKLERWMNAPQRPVEVIMPRFTLRSRGSLIEPLKALGMKRAFESGQADFSGVTATLPLHIYAVNHNTMVAIDEVGGTAASVVGVMDKDKGKEPEGRVRFHADRPFLFLVRHPETKTVLFIGRVVDPTR